MKKRTTTKFDCAAKMPPLHHAAADGKFDIFKSEAVQWLIRQPDILSYIYGKAISTGNIVYNPHTGTWKGVDYHD